MHAAEEASALVDVNFRHHRWSGSQKEILHMLPWHSFEIDDVASLTFLDQKVTCAHRPKYPLNVSSTCSISARYGIPMRGKTVVWQPRLWGRCQEYAHGG
eukprot:1877384-Rhodomonas_salina.2